MNIFDCISTRLSERCYPNVPDLHGLAITTTDVSVTPGAYSVQRECITSLNYNRSLRFTDGPDNQQTMFRAERDFRRDLNRIITLPFEGELHNVRETVYRTNDQEAIEAMHRLMDKVYDR